MIEEFAVSHSSPFEPYDEKAFRGWAGVVLARRLDSFLDRWSAALAGSSEGISEALAGIATDLRRLSTAADDAAGCDALALSWHPLFGLAPLHQTDVAAPASALTRAAQAVLRIAETRPVATRVVLGAERRLVFAGHLLPPATILTVAIGGSVCRIAGEAGAAAAWTADFDRVSEKWRDASGLVDRIPQLSIAGQEILVHAMPRSLAEHDPKVIAPDQPMVEALAAAFAMLAGSASYTGWVARTLRMVIPLLPIPGQYDSESFAALVGGAYISLHPDPVRTAETLVHETSHDYLHLLLGLDPLADASGSESFWSPPRNCQRPALGILKAHHAFANVLCFYYLLRLAHVPLDGAYARGIDRLEAWHSHFVDCLERAQSVTGVGEALWRPVTHRVEQLAAIAGRKVT